VTPASVRVGRPRSAEADDAILDAALDQFCEFGYDGLSVERVAACAGVAKTTIYRRYPTKLDLVMAALERAKEDLVVPEDSGSLRDDLLAMARSYLAMLESPTIGRAIPMMLASKARSDELAAAHAEFVRARRAPGYALIRQGIERGELPDDADPAMIADMLTGAIFTRVFVTGSPTDDAYLDALVDRIIAG
jgi:AcrR family transcriptional regulator